MTKEAELSGLIQAHEEMLRRYEALTEQERYSWFGIGCYRAIMEKASFIRRLQNQIKQ